MPPDWNTRLVVSVNGTVITPIDNFTPTFATPHTVIHSVEADNVGFIRGNQTFTFTMTVKANAPTVATLTQMALAGTEFQIAVAEQSGTDWAFNSITLSRCLITSSNPSNITVDGVPAASFTCSSLQATAA
jgi:hypothetical protein